MFFIALSPLVKIFLPEWHDRLQEDPDLIYDDKTEFDFIIPTGTSAIRVKFGTPQLVNGPDQKQNETLLNWMTGGPRGTECQETDCFGIALFNPKVDLISTLDRINLLDDDTSKGAKEKQAKLQADAKANLKSERVIAKAVCEERIKRALRFNHNNLVAQWQRNEEMKMGKYPPSITERLGIIALDKEIQKAAAKGSKINEATNKIMNMQAV